MDYPAEPDPSKSVGITIAAASARVELPRGFSVYRIYNGATETVFAKLGDNTVAATASYTGNMAIGPGITEVLTIRTPVAGGLYLAAIGTGATGTLGITPCLGGL